MIEEGDKGEDAERDVRVEGAVGPHAVCVGVHQCGQPLELLYGAEQCGAPARWGGRPALGLHGESGREQALAPLPY